MSDSPRSNDVLRIVLVVLAILVFVPVVMMAVAMPFGMMGVWGVGMGGGFGDGGGVRTLFVLVAGLVPLLVLVGGGYLLVRVLASDGGSPSGEDPALAELRVAYARGDLTDEEFEERRERLTDERDAGR